MARGRSGGGTSAVRGALLVAAVALTGAVASLALAGAAGMSGAERAGLGRLLVLAVAVTTVLSVLAATALGRLALRWRLAAVAGVAALAALANLGGLTLAMAVSPHDATVVAVLLVYALAAGVASALVLARRSTAGLVRLDRTVRSLAAGDLDARVGPLADPPELARLAGTLDDMAARLAQARSREQAVEATRRDLVTAVSHDLRTPLASLRAMVEAVADDVVDDPESLRRYAEEMRRAVTRLSRLVDDLFELAQLDAGAIEAETRRVRLDRLVADALAAVSHSAREKRLDVAVDLSGAEDTPCSPRLVRVLENLLVNAVRHTPSDGTVRVTALRTAPAAGPGELEVLVEDTGEGIAARDLDHVFEPFYRADPARSGAGAGLGLALVQRIVEALGGRVRATSKPGHGSRFAVTLPL